MAGRDFCYSLAVSQGNTSHSLAGLQLLTFDTASLTLLAGYTPPN